MRLLIILTFLSLIAACSDADKTKPAPNKAERRFLYLFGFVYGPIEKIEENSENSINSNRDSNVLVFYDNGKRIGWKAGISSYEMYYDDRFRIDSSIVDRDSKKTVIFYKFPYYEDYVHYSVTNGQHLDSIIHVIDPVKRSVNFIMDGALSSTDYFDEEGLMIKKELRENSTERYVYDEFGNITEKYISTPRANISNFKFEEVNYGYDSCGNWIKKELQRMQANGSGYTRTTSRIITYRK